MSKVASRIVLRGGVYQYRRRVPDDVRKLGGFDGKEIFQASLKTPDPVKARQEAANREAWFERECAKARGLDPPVPAVNDVGGQVLSDSYLKSLQDRYVAVALRADVTETFEAQSNPELRDWLEYRDAWAVPSYVLDDRGSIINRETTEARQREREIEEIRRRVAPDVTYQANQFRVSPGSREYDRIEQTFIEAELRTLSGRRERKPGIMFGGTYRPADALGGPIKVSSTWTLRALADEYLRVTPSGGSWQHKVNVGVALFEQFLGEPTPISAITRDHVREFLELLAMSPQRSSMRFPKLGLREAIEANKARKPKPYPLVGSNTIRDNHFAVLRVLFAHAFGELGAISHDPTDRMKVKGSTKKGGRSSHFEIEELIDLFKLPPFAGCRSEKRTLLPGNLRLDDHQFWTPLIMLFSGARPSEIAQLAVSDIKLQGQHPRISILTEYDPNDPEDRPYVLAYKTENARRNVPLNPTLIELGFGMYVDRMRAEGHERLFPNWKASVDPRKLYSGATWVRRFNDDYVPAVTNKKPKPSIYSLRHTFKTQMAICRVPPQWQDQVMGHAGPRMDPTYLKNIPIPELYAELAKVQYPGLDLSHLSRGKPTPRTLD